MVDRKEQDRRLRRFDAMDAGRDAALVSSVIVPLINSRITTYIQQLAGLYRGGQLGHDMLLGKVAEITAMLNLIADLEGAQRQGDIAAEKELGDGQET